MTLTVPIVLLLGTLGLLGVGFYGLLRLRHLIKLVIALQIIGKGIIVALTLAGHLSGQPQLGQSLALTVIVSDTVVAVIGLALAVQVRRRLGTLDVADLATLRG